MVSRLLLGCGSIGGRIVERFDERSDRFTVVTDDEKQVETLRSEGIRARVDDWTDPDVLREVADDVDTVVVAGTDPDRNEAAAGAARTVFPEAYLLAFTDWTVGDDARERLADLADDVVDPARVVASEVLDDVVGEAGVKLRGLRRTLRAISPPLAVVTHDNPDPDAIASAVALCRIAGAVGIEADACYFGEITHQENRALVNLLDLDLENLDPEDVEEYESFALVDHSRPGVNDQLPEDLHVDIVLDHHPPRAPVSAGFVDLRSDVGATSTLLTDYLAHYGVALDATVATALLYGIRVDTRDFSREVSRADFEAAATLLPHVDATVLDRVESPSVGTETLETLGRAIRNREVEGGVLGSCVGKAAERDALAQAADHLLNMEGVSTTLVYGFRDGTIYISARTRGTDLDLGETLRMAFDQVGSAGGHADMAAAQIPMGFLGTIEDEADETLTSIVSDVVMDRFSDALRERPGEFAAEFVAQTSDYGLSASQAHDGVLVDDVERAGDSGADGPDAAGATNDSEAEGNADESSGTPDDSDADEPTDADPADPV